MTTAEMIAEFLASKSCTHAFGVVGGANSLLFKALSQRMEIVCNAHEQASAMAATYYYRIAKRIAPVLVTAGAGCVNAFTGVMAAHFDGIPLLVLSGNEKSMYMNQATTRCMGFQGLMPAIVTTPFTKITVTADTPAVTKLALRALYDSATGHRQGPCWLDIPQDILAMEAA